MALLWGVFSIALSGAQNVNTGASKVARAINDAVARAIAAASISHARSPLIRCSLRYPCSDRLRRGLDVLRLACASQALVLRYLIAVDSTCSAVGIAPPSWVKGAPSSPARPSSARCSPASCRARSTIRSTATVRLRQPLYIAETRRRTQWMALDVHRPVTAARWRADSAQLTA